MSEPRYLTSADVEHIAGRIQERQARFGEDFTMSVGVVLLNLGDRFVNVACVGGEWCGTKGDLTPRQGIPLCPNGHPLVETSTAPRLALCEEGDDAHS